MYIDDINFPNQIIDALNEKKLIVFAGAGVSMGEPTCLPDFIKMANKIAEGTGKTVAEGESCDNFLGDLKSKGIEVNNDAASIILDVGNEYNKMHEAIIGLFKDSSDIKIVTTNYDKMFEKVCKAKDISIQVFNAPALPLGDDISGIVHVHGNVENPKYMVVTDDDFGKAYLTEGYAARFLKKLFESYVILFIGYSYKDTILKYLTRAMTRKGCKDKYILTDDVENDWNMLGITPINFPHKAYDKAQDSILRLGDIVNRGFLDWKNQFVQWKKKSPKDLSLVSEIEYCLGNIEKAKIFSTIIEGREWAQVLYEKGVFDNLFDSTYCLNDYDKIWSAWFIENVIGIDDGVFKKFYIEKRNDINPEFGRNILRKLIDDGKGITDNIYGEYVLVLNHLITNPYNINMIIDELLQREMYSVCFELFTRHFKFVCKIEKDFMLESYEYKCQCKSGSNYIYYSWENCKEAFLRLYVEELLCFSRDKIIELYNKYAILNKEGKFPEPWEVSMFDIENIDDENLDEDLFLKILCEIYQNSIALMEQERVSYVKDFIIQCVKHKSILLQRLALQALRKSMLISSCEKFDIVMENLSSIVGRGKQQIFLLIKDIFEDLTQDRIDKLIDKIETIEVYDDEHVNEYAKYNWCVWIKSFCNTNSRINDLENELKSESCFPPILHPELDMYSEPSEWIPDISPVTKNEMLHLNLSKLVNLLNTYSEDSFEGPSRDGLMQTFYECVKNNYKWLLDIVHKFADGEVIRRDAWERLLMGIENSSFSVSESVSLLMILSNKIYNVKDVLGLSRLFYSVVRKSETKANFANYEKELVTMSRLIYEYRDEKDYECKYEKTLHAVLNTTLGNIMLSTVYMISYNEKKKEIPNIYISIIESALELTGYERKIVLCVLVGQFNFLYCMDKEWCEDKLKPFLTSNDIEDFMAAWEGMTYFSRTLNKNVADVLLSVYFSALVHLDWLNYESKTNFIDMFLLLLIYFVENPCEKYIPEFYKYALDDDKKRFVHKIGYRFREMELEQKLKWWNGWLKEFFIKRFENKPVRLEDKEKKEIINILPNLEKVFDEAVDIIIKEELPKEIDSLFWTNLEGKDIVSGHEEKVYLLLKKILKSKIDIDEIDINVVKRIVKRFDSIDGELEEALLQRGILDKRMSLYGI